MSRAPLLGPKPLPVGQRPTCMYCGKELKPNFRALSSRIEYVYNDYPGTSTPTMAKYFDGTYGIKSAFCSGNDAIRFVFHVPNVKRRVGEYPRLERRRARSRRPGSTPCAATSSRVAARGTSSFQSICSRRRKGLPYPEHEKLKAVVDSSQAIGEFIEWLNNVKHFWIAEYVDVAQSADRLIPIQVSTNDLLAEHFGIDQKKLDQEKRAMLDEFRQAGKGA